VTRQQLDKFLLRHGRRWSAGNKWTHKHWKWIKVQEFPEEASRALGPCGSRLELSFWALCLTAD
jgi:hypothetical protein